MAEEPKKTEQTNLPSASDSDMQAIMENALMGSPKKTVVPEAAKKDPYDTKKGSNTPLDIDIDSMLARLSDAPSSAPAAVAEAAPAQPETKASEAPILPTKKDPLNIRPTRIIDRGETGNQPMGPGGGR